MTSVTIVSGLGILLYQLLHEGRTPWERFLGSGPVALGMRIADTRTVIPYYPKTAWEEQEKLLREVVPTPAVGENRARPSERSSSRPSSEPHRDSHRPSPAGAQHQPAPMEVGNSIRSLLLRARTACDGSTPTQPNDLLALSMWMRVDYLFRVCQKCLTFAMESRPQLPQLRELAVEEQNFFGDLQALETELAATNFSSERDLRESTDVVKREEPSATATLSPSSLEKFGLRLSPIRFKALPRPSQSAETIGAPLDSVAEEEEEDFLSSDEYPDTLDDDLEDLIASLGYTKEDVLVTGPRLVVLIVLLVAIIGTVVVLVVFFMRAGGEGKEAEGLPCEKLDERTEFFLLFGLPWDWGYGTMG